MLISKQEKRWVDFVKVGRLDEAYAVYLNEEPGFKISKFLAFRSFFSLISAPIMFAIKSLRPALNLSDTEVDLSEEFLIFWKCPNLIGRLLLFKILASFLRKKSLPARALAWYGHWLVFQGRYDQSAYIFRYLLTRIPKTSRLYGEVLSLVGNHFYSRNKLDESVYFHKRSNTILLSNGDKFFQMFNLGTSAKVFADLGVLEDFNKNILENYDNLNPVEPDERYGMRVLIYASYLNFISGKNDLATQFYVTAEKSFKKSGSSLDKSIYCIYKTAILLFLSDLDGARTSIKNASKFLKSYGRYTIYEKVIKSIEDYLTVGNVNPRITKNLLFKEASTSRTDLEAWYKDFFSNILPLLEKFQDENIENIRNPLEMLTKASIEITCLKSEITIDDVKDCRFVSSDVDQDSTVFKLELFHSEKKFELTLATQYKKWRNPEIIEAIRSILVLLQNISRQGQLKTISNIQSQKIKENEVARRIAHDIRSPLAALHVAVSNLSPLIKDYKIIKSSTQRIEDITNSLTRKRACDLSDNKERILIKSFLDSLIASKRFEFQSSQCEIFLEYLNDSASKYLFVNELELSRTLSNVINNALEAYTGHGLVEIIVDSVNSNLSISVKDQGCGINQKFLNRVFDRDFSMNKEGSGLGLYYARQFIDSCDGSITLSSDVEVGTCVTLELPVSLPPSWIKTTLFLDLYKNVVIVDDFPQNVEAMAKRITESCPHKTIVTFSNTADFLEAASYPGFIESSFFIMDYDFVNSNLNGIDLILEKKLEGRSVLATHNFENEKVIKKCIESNIKILPKIIFDSIQIIDQKTNVFIVDDEKYFLKALKGKLAGKYELHLFESCDRIVQKAIEVEGESFFFIDQNFEGSTIKGESLITSLKDLGKLNLYNISEDPSYFHKEAVKMSKMEIVNFLS
jgi:signal transduction histidine kinase